MRRDRHVTRAALVFLIALAVLFGLRAAGVAGAAGLNFVVNDTTDRLDANVGDGLCRTSAGTCSLRAAVQEANALPGADSVQLPAGTYELGIPPLNQNDVTTGDLDITDSLTISGAGAGSTFVDGGNPPPGAPPQVHGLDRLFEVLVEGGTVVLSNLTLREGSAAEFGGAIAINSVATVDISASILTGNVAGKTGGAIDNHVGGTVHVRDSTLSRNYATESGSALNNNRDGTVTLANVTVADNSAEAVGLDDTLSGAGAVGNNAELDARGSITVGDSRFSDNSAGGGRSGAAISNDGAGIVTVDETTFTKNTASANGGAIFNNNGEVSVADGAFTENHGKDGGALYSTGAGVVTVSDSSFTLNGALANGGALATSGAGFLTVTDSTFSKNEAEDSGGAVSNADKGSIAIADSTFTENSGLNGGGFSNEGSGLVTVERSSFSKNQAVVTILAASGEGGGMHSNSGGEVVIADSTFTENKAGSGGGLANEGGGQMTITSSSFATNIADEAGGGILIQSGAVRMVDIDVTGNLANSALEGGGGISYAGDKAVADGESAALESSRIRNNKSNGDGGGIDSRGDGPLSITTTVIAGNTSLIGGAINHVGDAPLLVDRSTLSGNVADNGGAVFSDGDGEAEIRNTTVSGNRAGQFGGGLLVSSRMFIRNSTVSNNNAPSGGGINNGGGDIIGDGAAIVANTIVANNPTGGNCAGTMTSRGGNVDNANSCAFTQLSDQPGTNPRLGPLADNGGPTQTHALLAGSPAQNGAACTELDPCPPVDQRGVPRPRFTGFDAGAYESELPPEGGGGQQCAGLTERPVAPDYDSWVSQSAASTNFGTDAILRVDSQSGGNERALVHFTLPPVPPGCRLVSASLRLYSPAATDGRTLQVLRAATPWTELSVTWNAQPATAGPAAISQSGLDVREWDVLAQTSDMYTLGQYGFLIRDAAENQAGTQSFHSREKGADRPPLLVLVFDDPDGPPLPGSCPTTPQSLAADRDSWVSQGSPTNNFGNDSTLKIKSQVGSNSRVLLRFPLPALPAGCTGVASALLRMEADSVKEGHALEALQAASAWTESGVTWNNQPATVGPAATIPSVQGVLEWSVTSQILGMYSTANNGFLLRDVSENGVGDEQTLNSRDKVGDGPPELVFVFDDSTPETEIDDGPVSPTANTQATFSFSSDRDDATFECSLDVAAFQPCTSPRLLQGLAEGSHSFQVRATRRVRAVDPTPASHGWTVAIPPETSVSGPASPSNSTSATLTFSADDPAATFECSLNGAEFDTCVSPLLLEHLPDGLQDLRVRGVDPFGNADPTPAAHGWLVAVPPETSIDSGPRDPSNSTDAAFSFSGSDNGTAPSALAFECSLDGGDWATCSDGQAYTDLADGAHTFEVRATDAAGNTDASPASFGWAVDTVAPETTIDSGPPDPTNDSSAAFEFRAADATGFECNLDAGEWAACSSGQSYADLADGEHTFAVRAADLAGNVGAPASHAWTIDTVPPEASIDSGADGLTNDPTPTFSFSSEPGASLACRVDDAELAPCASPYTTAPLGDGGHTFDVRATDAAGNTGAAAGRAFTVDTVAPVTVIESGPPQFSNSTAASFVFVADEVAAFECRLDSGDWAACTSPQAYGPLDDGGHSFAVQATDPVGNLGAAVSHAWTIDTVAPVTTIGNGPPALSMSSAASFAFGADELAGFECSLDEGDWAVCSSPSGYADLADGAHSFAVRATDRAGNLGAAASYAWTIDTVAPLTTIENGPPALSKSSAASFEFGGDEPASFECSLDEGEWATCSSPQAYGPLADGEHSFAVRATDEAGNLGAPVSFAWTIDTVAPATAMDEAPADPSSDPSPSFAFSADEPASFECRLDEGEWATCTSPQAYFDLADGEHSFAVRATDPAGNRGAAASYAWTIDTVAPVTTIENGPTVLSKSSAASFAFVADEPAAFECRLDEDEWATCTSARRYDDLADGAHSFAVRATDRAGNLGAAASYAWRIDTVAPVTAIDEAPADPSNDSNPRFAFSASEAASFECRLDAGDWATCASPQAYGPLGDGEHSFAVRATDDAGNLGAAASYAWTIDTVAPVTTIENGPPALSKSSAASFVFAADEAAAFECRLDEGDWAACTSPQAYGPLADGEHSFAVRATDEAGNPGAAASYAWTVDTVAPVTTIENGPPVLSKSPAASFAFVADEAASFECRLDEGDWAVCTSPSGYDDVADGEQSFAVRATDEAGNLGAPASFAWTIDTVAPVTAIDEAPADPSNDSSPSFAFSADEPASFECRLDEGDWAACTSPQAYTALGDGEHSFAVRATDLAGNLGAAASYAWTIDTVAPVTTIDEAPADPSNDPSPSFAFSADEPAGFECRLDEGDWAACTSPQAYADLADGTHSFAVRATDPAGNVGAPASHAWVLDTIAPVTTIEAGPPALTNGTAASFGFVAHEAASFECRLDEGDWAECASPQAYGALGDGEHSFAVRATDEAGNLGTAAVYAWTVDTVAPATAIDAGPSGLTNDSTPTFAFSSELGASFECRVDAAAFAACGSQHTTAALADGGHSFDVRATDAAGNTGGAASRSFTVDTVAPVTLIDAGPGDLTNDSTPTFGFSSEPGATFECRLDAAAFAACTSPHTTAALADGGHTFAVRATDAAGNTGAAASRAFTVDTVAPVTSIGAGPSGPTNDSTPTFTFSSELVAGFECRVDAAAFAACGSPHTTAALADGGHTFEVRATDAAGNTGAAASRAFTVDTIAPATTIDAGPSGLTDDSTPTFEFSSEPGAGFECRVDAAAFATCTSPYTTAALADGGHTFDVRATDAAGNTGAAASRAFTVDTAGPATTIENGPSGLTNDSTPTFGFSSEPGASFQCRVDAAAFAACSSPHTTAPLADGAHSFEVRASDAAGITGTAASRAFTVDTVAPATTIETGPSGLTNDSTPTFGFSSEPGASFQCRVDSAAFAACASPHTTAALADGGHTFDVRASDAAGNTGGAASRSLTVDTVAPATTIGAGPTGVTNDSTPTFGFSSEPGASFQCRVDSAAFAACSSPHTTAALAEGSHSFEVRASDAAGNMGAAAGRAFTVDTVAPQTTIGAGAPPATTTSTSATFNFSSSEPNSTFACSLDNAAFTPCTSPRSYSGLTVTSHTFRVQATDAAGNTDASPASHNWTIQPAGDTTPPQTTIGAGAPPATTTSTSATFNFSSSEPNSTFACSLDNAAFTPCTSPRSYSGLTVTSHTFRVQATDAAGNTDGSPATHSWTIQPPPDTTQPDTTITGNPPNPSNSTSATFSFTGTDNATPQSMLAFQCRVDTQAYASCSSPRVVSGLAQGSRTFQVRAIDLAGNIDQTPASFTWTVDLTAPETTIGAGSPPATTSSTSATFNFASETGATFQCSLDNAAFTPCTSPQSYSGLSNGSHQFRVRAIDAAGNIDATPAAHNWTIAPPGSCIGSTVTVAASADGWLLESSATSNYGSDSVLKVDSKAGGNAQLAIRFALPTTPAGCNVVNARLRLYASSFKSGRTLHALRLGGAWTEGGITWANQPAAVGSPATAASAGGYVEWAALSQVQSMYTDSNNGFVVRDAVPGGSGIEQNFHSREKGTDNPPQLVITFG